MSELKGLRAVVTGGASGIGAATARLLAHRGAEVCVLDVAPRSVTEPLHGCQADVSDDASVRAAIQALGAVGAAMTDSESEALEWVA
jgi:NAD(P)-dependent dehydrogenase (short-subunit alcohol dehydrogenase family)